MNDDALESCLDVKPEVRSAVESGAPIVALESTIITHGMPYPQNVQTAREVEQIVRSTDAVPATIAILNGRLKVGLTETEIEHLGQAGPQVLKTSRRDIPFIVAGGQDGATTVAATMIIAAMGGIGLFATGGIGGVHRGAGQSFDVSADLQELARTNVAVVCAGVTSILDIGLTLEYLETLGVPVVGYQTTEMPAFYTRESGFHVDYRLDDPEAMASAIKTKWDLKLDGGVIVANPIPEKYAMDPDTIDGVISAAIEEMNRRGISGKESTPFLLARIAEESDGESLAANIQLVRHNAALAARIAVAYSAIK